MLLFVYGSLKKGFCNYHYMKNAKFLNKCRTKDKFTMFNLGEYPAISEEPSYQIEGELYEIADDDLQTLQNIDELEQYPDFYDKKIIQLDSEEFAMVYYIRENIIRTIKSASVMSEGNWKISDYDNFIERNKN
jgi:gamma-glutamylcyclotransferase (GGCT)/AIG2-like uncharacterized protein YtfP